MASALQHMEVDDDATTLPGRKRNRQVAEEPEELADVPENTAINPSAPSSKKRRQGALPPSMPVPPPMHLHPPVPTQAWPKHIRTEIPSNHTGISVGVVSSRSLAAPAPAPPTPAMVPPAHATVPPAHAPVPPAHAPVPPAHAMVPPAHAPVPPARAPVPPAHAAVPPALAENSGLFIGRPADFEHEDNRSSDEGSHVSDETDRNWHENERNSEVNDNDDFYVEDAAGSWPENDYPSRG